MITTRNDDPVTLYGLSTDTKPTDRPNGSKFLEIDSGITYRFDIDSMTWYEQKGSGMGESLTPEEITELIEEKAIIPVVLTDTTLTMSQVLTQLEEINSTGKHVFFDVSAFNAQMYLCTIFINDYDNPTAYRVTDAVTGRTSVGAYDGTETLLSVLNKSIEDFVTFGVTIKDADNVPAPADTLTVHVVNASTGAEYDSTLYNGQLASFVLPAGFNYKITCTGSWSGRYGQNEPSGVAVASGSFIITYKTLSTISTFQDIKDVLNQGGGQYIEMGTQVSFNHTRFGNLVFDVVDYDSEEDTITLLTHEAFTDMPFDAPEASYMVKDNDLPAGSYYFTVTSTNYYFTLLANAPVGCQLRMTNTAFYVYYNGAYNAGETGTVSTTAIAGATSLGTCGIGRMNNWDRIRYGSNNYAESNLFQWLNSSDSYDWWTRKTDFDRPSTYTQNTPGFLEGVPQNILDLVETVDVKCSTNTVYECSTVNGGTYTTSSTYTVQQKFYFASQMEIFGTYEGTFDGSKIFDYYVGAENIDRIKYKGTTAKYWWFRSFGPSRAHNVRAVSLDGSLGNNGAISDGGVVLACQLKKDNI